MPASSIYVEPGQERAVQGEIKHRCIFGGATGRDAA